MLSLLLDEQISPKVAEQLRLKRPEIPVQSLHIWREGFLMGRDDALVLEAAASAGMTLVTYDLKTIPPLLSEWGGLGKSHAGVIFVDGKALPSHDFGALIRAIVLHWERCRDEEWRNRVDFLRTVIR